MSRLCSAAICRAIGLMKMRPPVSPVANGAATWPLPEAGICGCAGVDGVAGAACAVWAAGAAAATGCAAGADACVAFAAAGSASLAAPTSAIGAPTAIVSPAGTRILRSVPAKNDSTSMLTFSVSISASASPFLTVSPSCLSQRRILPSSIVSPSLGITTVCIPGLLCARTSARRSGNDGFHRRDDVVAGRQGGLLQWLRVWHRHIFTRNMPDRRVKIIKAVFVDQRRKSLAGAVIFPAFFSDDHTVGLAQRIQHQIEVNRAHRTQINHLRLDALFRQFLGSLEREMHHAREGHDGHIRALAPHDATVQRHGIL